MWGVWMCLLGLSGFSLSVFTSPPGLTPHPFFRFVGFLTAGTVLLWFLNYWHWVKFSAAGAAGVIFHQGPFL